MAQVVPLDTDSDALESAVAGAPLGPVRLTASFLANRERGSLPYSMGGLAIRRDPGYKGDRRSSAETAPYELR